jgi:hypothetical protein
VEERGVVLPLLPCLDEASVLEALDRPSAPTAIRTRVLKAIARHGAPQLHDWAAGIDAASLARLEGLVDDAPCWIRPLQPMQARPDEMAAWEAAFTAHEIATPFPVFARGSFALAEAEKSAPAIERFVGRHVPAARLRGLAGRGFLLGPVEDEGKVYCFRARVATVAEADAMLTLHFGDGLGRPPPLRRPRSGAGERDAARHHPARRDDESVRRAD